MKIYEFAALFNPDDDEKKDGKKAEIIVKPTTILANDEKEAMLKAARAIPEDFVDKLDKVEIAVRPF